MAPQSLAAGINRSELDNGITYLSKQNILFPSIPKNASTTMRGYFKSLEKQYMPSTAQLSNIKSDVWKHDPRICVIIRDPIARHLSATAMLTGTIKRDFGITVNVGDFIDLGSASDVHLVPQWAFVPLTDVPKFEGSFDFLNHNTWNSFYFDLMGRFDFNDMITDKYDFFWMSEDPNDNVWVDICKYYGMRVLEDKEHVSVDRKDRPIQGLGEMISNIHKHYACDYDFIHRIKFKNLRR